MKQILTYFTPAAIRRSIGLQFVYCMGIFPARFNLLGFRWVVKVGVTDSPMQRRKDVQAGIRAHTGEALHVYCLPIPVFAFKQCEAAVHQVLRLHTRDPFPNTTGHTEWFISLNLLCGFLVACCAVAEGMPFTAAVGWWALVALLPVPFDAAILIVLVAAIHWGVFVLAIWCGAKVLMMCGLSGLL